MVKREKQLPEKKETKMLRDTFAHSRTKYQYAELTKDQTKYTKKHTDKVLSRPCVSDTQNFMVWKMLKQKTCRNELQSTLEYHRVSNDCNEYEYAEPTEKRAKL